MQLKSSGSVAKEKTLINYCISAYYQSLKVPGGGLEPPQPLWPLDFKSNVSTIPPSGHPVNIFKKGKRKTGILRFQCERETRLELATPTLARSCSTN